MGVDVDSPVPLAFGKAAFNRSAWLGWIRATVAPSTAGERCLSGLSAERRTLFTHANLVFVTFVSLC